MIDCACNWMAVSKSFLHTCFGFSCFLRKPGSQISNKRRSYKGTNSLHSRGGWQRRKRTSCRRQSLPHSPGSPSYSDLKWKFRELKTGKEMLPIVERHLNEAESALSTLRDRESTLGDQVHELQAFYEQKRQSAQEYKSSNRLNNALMREKIEGRIPGIFGRLVR